MWSHAPVTVLGLDPGYDRLGWCIGHVHGGQFSLVKYGCIQTQKSDTWTSRYRSIMTALSVLLREHSPQEAALEEVFFSVNKKSALQVSEVRGVLLSLLIQHDVACFSYGPSAVKLAVAGTGAATKQEVAKMLRLQLGSSLTTMTGAGAALDDAWDAVAVALTHGVLRSSPKTSIRKA